MHFKRGGIMEKNEYRGIKRYYLAIKGNFHNVIRPGIIL
jgi:hypothetical protein